MQIIASLIPENKTKKVKIKENAKVIDLLKKLNINPEIVIVLRGKLPLPIDEILKDGEKIKVVRVVSGG